MHLRRTLAIALSIALLGLSATASASYHGASGPTSGPAGGPVPTVAILSPATGATVPSDVDVQLAVNGLTLAPERVGQAKNGNEGHLHFSVDGGAEFPVTSDRYTLTDLVPGRHTLTVKTAYNDHSYAGAETTIHFVVAEKSAPAISIVSPLNGATVEPNSTVRLAVENLVIAPDQVGAAKSGNQGHIHLSIDGGAEFPVTALQYQLSDLAPGPHTLVAKLAYNDHSYTGAQDGVRFTVGGPAAPAMRIAWPLDGSVVAASPAVRLEIANLTLAPDQVGKAQNGDQGHVHFSIDGGAEFPVTALTQVLSDLQPGPHTLLTRLAYNDHTYTGAEDRVTFTVGNAAPSFLIASPAAGATVGPDFDLRLVPLNLRLAPDRVGQARDGDEGHFHLSIDGGQEFPVTTETYRVEGLAPGWHTLTVKSAYNDHSYTGAEQTLNVLVGAAAGAPTLSVSAPRAIAAGEELVVRADVTHFRIVNNVGGANAPGEGHLHFVLDGGAPLPVAALPGKIGDIPAGDHTLVVSLHHNDHSPIGVAQEVHFSVVEPVNKPEARIMVQGRAISLDVPPFVVGGRTFLPFRAVGEALGGQLEWIESTQTVVFRSGGGETRLNIGDPVATVNGRAVDLEVPAFIRDGRTLVPLRFLAEATGARVDWQPTWEITVTP